MLLFTENLGWFNGMYQTTTELTRIMRSWVRGAVAVGSFNPPVIPDGEHKTFQPSSFMVADRALLLRTPVDSVWRYEALARRVFRRARQATSRRFGMCVLVHSVVGV